MCLLSPVLRGPGACPSLCLQPLSGEQPWVLGGGVWVGPRWRSPHGLWAPWPPRALLPPASFLVLDGTFVLKRREPRHVSRERGPREPQACSFRRVPLLPWSRLRGRAECQLWRASPRHWVGWELPRGKAAGAGAEGPSGPLPGGV